MRTTRGEGEWDVGRGRLHTFASSLTFSSNRRFPWSKWNNVRNMNALVTESRNSNIQMAFNLESKIAYLCLQLSLLLIEQLSLQNRWLGLWHQLSRYTAIQPHSLVSFPDYEIKVILEVAHIFAVLRYHFSHGLITWSATPMVLRQVFRENLSAAPKKQFTARLLTLE